MSPSLVAAVGLILLQVEQPHAAIEPIPISEMTARATLIVSGKIVGLDEEAFAFGVDRVIKGAVGTNELPLRVARMAVPRWAPYEVGQQLVLFVWPLARAAERTVWLTLGGDSGEVPVSDGKAYFQAPANRGWHLVEGRRFFGVEASREMLLDAVQDYGRLYRWTFSFEQQPTIEQLASDDVIDLYARRSAVHGRMVRQTQQHPGLNLLAR